MVESVIMTDELKTVSSFLPGVVGYSIFFSSISANKSM
jgi:hypothetical protein